MMPQNTSSAIGIKSMARSPHADCAPWASGTSPLHRVPPWQNGFAERLIGSIRRECLDHIIVLGEAHLRRILKSYADYYNGVRTHRSLNKMRRSLVKFSGPEASNHTPSLADFITATSGFELSVHTGVICRCLVWPWHQADVFNLIGDRNVIRVFGALFPFLCFREPVVTPLNIGLRFLVTYRSFRAARNIVIHFRGHFGVSKPGDDSHSVVREAVSARRALRISRSCRSPGWVPIASLRRR